MEKFDLLGKRLSGSVLIIGFPEDSSFVRTFKNSGKTTEVYVLNNTSNGLFGKASRKKQITSSKKTKRISIKRLSKELKNIDIDHIVCNFEVIRPFFRNFIKNSIILTKDKLFIYLNDEETDPKEIEQSYKRFGINVTIDKAKNEHVFEIDIKDNKYPFFKGLLYRIRDFFYDLVEAIANILIG